MGYGPLPVTQGLRRLPWPLARCQMPGPCSKPASTPGPAVRNLISGRDSEDRDPIASPGPPAGPCLDSVI